MLTPLRLTSLLLISTALVAPAAARAQNSGAAGGGGDQTAPSSVSGAQDGATVGDQQPAGDAAVADQGPAADDQEQPEVSIPGAQQDIVVTGRVERNLAKTTPQVVSVLSTADIARTGYGDIAGALTRVTGLSVVGRGFVYVRGLGDRYSLALLNGSPLPSPEPLKRVVPLDIFPTSVVASSLVQKSYSVNFPAEFGGGVINLTTRTAPRDDFLTYSGSIGGDSETFNELGYTYRGGRADWTGFDNGTRDIPPALKSFFAGGTPISSGLVDTQAIGSELITSRKSIVQRNRQIPPNWSASVTAGKTFEASDATMGVIATAGISNKWLTRDTIQQSPASTDLSQKIRDFERVITDDRTIVSGLLGFALEIGDQKIRVTDLFIRDTIKEARLGQGSRPSTFPNATFIEQNTAWFERQLFDAQLVGEFKLMDDLRLDVRGGAANTRRKAPFETGLTYVRTNNAADPFGQIFVNPLNGNAGDATVAFSDLDEDLYSAGVDLSYTVMPGTTVTVGYAYSDTKRTSERREFGFRAGNGLPAGITAARPDLLLSPAVINTYQLALIENTESFPAFDAKLRIHGGYAKLVADFGGGFTADAGVRYETALQTVTPAQVFTAQPDNGGATRLDRDYWLPAVTLTWAFQPDMQLRFNVSKTIARPQFRELIFQRYYDPETNRTFQGNPALTDSQLYNAEARYEWYLGRDQRISVAGFYKRIDNPIEAFAGNPSENGEITSYANAPKATLYGGELEVQKYFELESWGGLFETRRALVSLNYSYTQSKIKVGAGDSVTIFQGTTVTNPATNYFKDGEPLTGQSDHIANLELGLEDTDKLSQQTFLLTYASKRVTSRGSLAIPADIIEKPGFRLDFVAREAIMLADMNVELKLEVRNITGTKYQEFQQVGDNRNYFNLYDVGTSVSLGASVNF